MSEKVEDENIDICAIVFWELSLRAEEVPDSLAVQRKVALGRSCDRNTKRDGCTSFTDDGFRDEPGNRSNIVMIPRYCLF